MQDVARLQSEKQKTKTEEYTERSCFNIQQLETFSHFIHEQKEICTDFEALKLS